MNSATSRVNPLTVGNSPEEHPAAEASCAATAESSIPGAALARVISFLRLSFISSRRRQYIPARGAHSGWWVRLTGGSWDLAGRATGGGSFLHVRVMLPT